MRPIRTPTDLVTQLSQNSLVEARQSGIRAFGSHPTPCRDNDIYITSDEATGIGEWTDARIGKALTTGERPNGRRLSSPMPIAYLARLTPDGLAALIAWLRTLPAVANPVEH